MDGEAFADAVGRGLEKAGNDLGINVKNHNFFAEYIDGD